MATRLAGDIGSVAKAVELLALLADHEGELGVNEAGRRLGLHKSTVSRLLATLARRGLVARNTRTGAFGLGPGLIRLAGAALRGMDVRSRARPVLERLADETRETIFLSIVDGGQALEIDEVAGSHAIRDRGWVGLRIPLHCTAAGMTLIAHLPPAARRELAGSRLKRYTPATVCEWGELDARLDAVRTRGYAVSSEEFEAGLVGIGAPVLAPNGTAAAALVISGPAFRLPARRAITLGRSVVAAAGEIATALRHSI
jgi:IclR family transcriptional regulator, acetate operon repressor